MRGCLFPTLSAMPTRSFSILELVMMLAIVGVLSAVAVPRIVSAGQHARSHRLMEDLQVLQRAADLYEAEHVVSLGRRSSGGNANAALVIARLVGRTDTEGNVDPVGEYGPYLKDWPQNDLTLGTRLVVRDTAAGAISYDWRFSRATGKFYPSVVGGSPTSVGRVGVSGIVVDAASGEVALDGSISTIGGPAGAQ